MNRKGDGDTEEDNVKKLFIGGLSHETTENCLRRHFSQYGEMIDCHVVVNSITMKSRCFGFVTFKDPSSVQAALAVDHLINNNKVEAKLCSKKAATANRIRKLQQSYRKLSESCDISKKVFVGGLPGTADENLLRKFFQEFGKVVDAVIVSDSKSHRPRGFGFVTFATDESVEKVCNLHFHNMQGKQIECKLAKPRVPRMTHLDCDNPRPIDPGMTSPMFYQPYCFYDQNNCTYDGYQMNTADYHAINGEPGWWPNDYYYSNYPISSPESAPHGFTVANQYNYDWYPQEYGVYGPEKCNVYAVPTNGEFNSPYLPYSGINDIYNYDVSQCYPGYYAEPVYNCY